LGLVWILAVLAALWATAMILVEKIYIFDNNGWHFVLDWNVDGGMNDITVAIVDLNPYMSSLSQMCLGLLIVFAVQSLQTIGLHCTELLVNMWRDEEAWRAAYVRSKKGLLQITGKQGGARLITGAFSSAILSKSYVTLFLLKALLHWLLGQSISPSIYIVPMSGMDGAELSDFSFSEFRFDIFYPRLIVYAIIAIVFAIFTTALALSKPDGPQPVAWGHLQTLADLVDDWTLSEDGDLWWGDKGSNHASIRHAGTSAKEKNLGEIVLDAYYEG
jgi:hypothetical protein